MKRWVKRYGAVCLCVAGIMGARAWAAPAGGEPAEGADKTLSPYFFIKSDDPSVDRLPLKATSADVKIAGMIADVKVVQVYRNEGKRPLEALYVFPASTRASVYGMKMTVGERIIEAQIRERREARKAYENAKQEGKSASLLEQQRPNVFQMNVANILPGDEITVELRYTELLIPEKGVYEFVYPTVVGPRYSNTPEGKAPAAEKWIQNPYLHEGEAPPYTFDIRVNVEGGVPIREVACPSHKTTVAFDGPSTALITLDSSEKSGGNRDYILRYRLDGDAVSSGLVLYRGETENFFLLMIQPPRTVTLARIPPREYVFVVDVSGSMRGFPLEISKKLLKDLIGGLRTSDRFNVLLFSGGSTVFSERSVPATEENIARALHIIEREHGGGGTELLPALERAFSLPGEDGFSRSVILVTDGYVAVEKEAFRLVRNRLGEANLFAFGIGSSVNRFLIEGMARAGMGEPFVITKPDEAPAQAAKFRDYVQSPVLIHPVVDFDGFAVEDVEPRRPPDLMAERPIAVFGKWRGEPRGTIRVSGQSGTSGYHALVDVSRVKPSENASALRYLWARHKIAALTDEAALEAPSQGEESRTTREITALGLQYGLLTAYTSFVAVDTLARSDTGKTVTVEQPLPLPAGVPDTALPGGPLQSARAVSPMPGGGAAPSMMRLHKRAEERDKGETEAPRARLLKVKVNGALSKESAERMWEEYRKSLEICLRGKATADPPQTGTAALKVSVDGHGSVTQVEWSSKEFGDEGLQRCIAEAVKRWRFPAPSDGKPVRVEYALAVLR